MYGGGEKKRKLNIKKKSESGNNIIKDVRSLFRQKKNEAVKDRIIRDIKNHFEQEKGQKPVIIGNFYSNNYI